MTRVGEIFRDSLVKRLRKGLDSNANAFIVNYSRMAGPKINDFRKSLKKAGASVIVSKNSIARIALKDIQQESLTTDLSDQTAFVLSNGDSAEISKILVKFSKDFENLKVKGGLLEGRALKGDDVKRLAELPSRPVLQAQLLGIIQAPISRLMNAMNAKSRDLLSILKQLSEKRGGS